eukprot:364653-Chlamydomonas_euryale.AAC.3
MSCILREGAAGSRHAARRLNAMPLDPAVGLSHLLLHSGLQLRQRLKLVLLSPEELHRRHSACWDRAPRHVAACRGPRSPTERLRASSEENEQQ